MNNYFGKTRHEKNIEEKCLDRGAKGLTLMFFVVAAIGVNAEEADSWRQENNQYGQPDIQGVWFYGTATPFTRPKELGDQQSYSDQEFFAETQKNQEKNNKSVLPIEPTGGAPEVGGKIGFQADFNFAIGRDSFTKINGEYRTSLVIDPANGQLPLKDGFKDFHARRGALGISNYEGPESTQGIGERCLPGLGVPTLYPAPWNANVQIVQNKEYVMLKAESGGPPRIIRLDNEHRAGNLDYWQGDSIAHWEKNTLVIHTTSFRPEQSTSYILPMSEKFELTERLTRVSDRKILYSYTIVDPLAFTQPITVETVFQRRNVRMFEVACHEGNYSMVGLLAGARAEELRAKNTVPNLHLSKEAIDKFAGNWQGEINGAHLSFKFEPREGGGMDALLDIPNRGVNNLLVKNLKIEGNEFTLVVPDIGASYSGLLLNDEISGEWSREDYNKPLLLTKR